MQVCAYVTLSAHAPRDSLGAMGSAVEKRCINATNPNDKSWFRLSNRVGFHVIKAH